MGNKSSSNSKVQYGKTTKVSSIEQHVPRQNMMSFQKEQNQRNKATSLRDDDEYIGKHYKVETSLDNDETFNNFIKRAKYKIRTVTMSKSNIDKEHSNNTVPAAPDHEANGNNNTYKENNQRDQFDDFIQISKKKMRASSSIRNSSFFKKP
ncbi:unnamed protein product [Trifolium pratense]|uniref:Uncharacterized protein n=2 Tax=Trifolium pratense TaxID=57577 RepID=A0ACB0IM78_TRIPR|nr:unnamed protein product [Trifolium pratense]CAJ2633198.1 unnamed protein product [Trifolium pratense]